MKDRLYAWCCALIVLAMSPVTALAARPEMEKDIVDARLEGYDKVNVTLAPSGTALMWLLLIFLTLVTVGVMFKDAKRSHLD